MVTKSKIITHGTHTHKVNIVATILCMFGLAQAVKTGTASRKACGIFYPVYFVAPVLAFIFIKQVIVIFS